MCRTSCARGGGLVPTACKPAAVQTEAFRKMTLEKEGFMARKQGLERAVAEEVAMANTQRATITSLTDEKQRKQKELHDKQTLFEAELPGRVRNSE